MHSYNSQTNNYGQSPKKAYYSNPNVDIYGKPVINTNLLNSEKAMILKEVEQNFNVKTLTNQMINNIKGDILNINLSITNDLILPIEIACDDMFPYTCPRITIKRNIKHEKIDPKTMEYQFYNDYQWNYQKNKPSCNLMNLITFMQGIFQKKLPETDHLTEKSQKLEQQVIVDIRNFELVNSLTLFPGKSTEELRTMVNYSQAMLDNFLIQHPNYKKSAQSLIDFIEFNQKNIAQITEQKKIIENKRTELESMAQLFDIKKENLETKFNQTNMIKERFNKTKILNLLEQEIGKLDDEGNDSIDFNFKKSVQINQFDEKLSEYFENRKKYHRFMIKKEKLEAII